MLIVIKNIAKIVTVAGLSLALLAGCGQSSEDDATTEPTETEDTTTEDAGTEDVNGTEGNEAESTETEDNGS